MTDDTTIPWLGYGTGPLTEEKQCVKFVQIAIEHGIRHIDTAQMYENERHVGKAIELADVNRNDLFISSKVHPKNLSYDDVISSTEQSADRLGVDTIDLMYVHWPVMEYNPLQTLRAFEELQDRGLINHIGLSNFTSTLLHEAVEELSGNVFAHQVEMHPLCQQAELHSLAQEYNHYLVAYSPLARGQILKVDEVITLAKENNLDPAQVAIAWLVSHEKVRPIVSSTNPRHIAANLKVVDLNIDSIEFNMINEITREYRVVDPSLDKRFS